MCTEIDDDFIEELAMGRGQGTKEEAHVLECRECQERLRQSREWIAAFRKVMAGDERRDQSEPQKKAAQRSESLVPEPLPPIKRCV